AGNIRETRDSIAASPAGDEHFLYYNHPLEVDGFVLAVLGGGVLYVTLA
ncbi:unnamed protein product, partial [marine sediment metagenome]